QQYRDLLVIHELYRQQQNMFDPKSNRIDDRIVSIQQPHEPHVRPIVRGKTSARMEFSLKISVSLVDGFSFLDVLDWNAYHEGNYLEQSIEAYFQRYGFYPEAVLVDQIYRTRENREYCKKLGICFFRLMNIAGIQSVIRRKRPKYQRFTPQHIAENLLNREFTAEKPNEKCVTDVTEFEYGSSR